MKKSLLIQLLLVACTFTLVSLRAQTINVVPNPTAPDLFAYTGGALSGYTGTPIILNNSLVLEYNPTGVSDPTQIKQQLAVYNGGDSLHLIPNPDGGQGVYFQSVQLIFNNALFFIYINASGIQQLASFNGTSITLYPNPDAGLGFIGSPRILNNKLYVVYSNVSGVTQFAVFNGSGITLIPNPDNSAIGFYNDYSVVFNNTISSRYVSADGTKHVATYNGTQWTVFSNPDNTTRGVYPAFPVQYKNKLYFTYFSATNQYQYLQFDGSNNPTLIANPQNSSINGANGGGISAFPIVLNDTLFFQYDDTANVGRLAKFDGTTITLVPNPDATPYGFYNTPVVYNNNLYIFYVTPDQLHHLAQYESASNSLKVYANPDAGNGYWDQPIVYDSKLYFIYYNVSGIFQLGYFDGGNSLKLIANPPGIYNGSSGNNGYVGQPVIWNNKLYMQFGSVPYGNAGNLAYFDGTTLPVTLLNFTGELQKRSVLLQWKTSTEINTASFTLERSGAVANFSAIANVAADGNSTFIKAYNYIDAQPLQGKIFYRLKMIDKDGKYTYSSIVMIDINGPVATAKIFPNPVTATLNVQVPLSNAGKVDIVISDVKGKMLIRKTTDAATANFSTSINTEKLAAGLYYISINANGKTETSTFVKQ